jgi:transcriptional regulator with XRE-family HTH domain
MVCLTSHEFGKYLKELRKSKKITVKALADKSGVSQSYLTNVENNKRGIPSPEILKKISGPLGVTYEELMIKAGYWKEQYSKEDRILFEGIYNTRSETIERIKEILKALADDNGIFPDELHKDLFNIIGGLFPQQVEGQYKFDDWFTEFMQTVENENTDMPIQEAHEEFNKYYNYTTLRDGIQQYNESGKSLEDIQHELIELADKHGIELQVTKPLLTNIDLGDILSDESVIIRYNGKLISPADRYRIIGFLDALSIINTTNPSSDPK